MARVYLSLGSNIDRDHYIRTALDILQRRFGDLVVSPVYESESVGFEGDNFYNLVVGIDAQVGVGEGDLEGSFGAGDVVEGRPVQHAGLVEVAFLVEHRGEVGLHGRHRGGARLAEAVEGEAEPSLGLSVVGALQVLDPKLVEGPALEAGALVPEDQIPPGLDLLFGPQVQPYLIDILSRDPVALAQNYDGPALVVQGARDLQVGPEDAERLVAALSGAEALPLPEATHMLKPDQPGLPMATYLNPTLPLDPALVPGIIAFLDRHPPR